MIKEVEIMKVETKIIYFCDICGEEVEREDVVADQPRWYTCKNCHMDLCRKHSHCEDFDADKEQSGDYCKDYFCPECYAKYRYFQDVIKPEHENDIKRDYELIMRVSPKKPKEPCESGASYIIKLDADLKR